MFVSSYGRILFPMCTETEYNHIEYLSAVMLQLHPPQHHRAASLHPRQGPATPPPSPAAGSRGVDREYHLVPT